VPDRREPLSLPRGISARVSDTSEEDVRDGTSDKREHVYATRDAWESAQSLQGSTRGDGQEHGGDRVR